MFYMMLMKKVFILSVSLGFLSSGQTFFKFSYSKKAFFGVPKVHFRLELGNKKLIWSQAFHSPCLKNQIIMLSANDSCFNALENVIFLE